MANGSEGGNMAFAIQDSGSLLEHMRINTAGVVVNEVSQAGTDFRVESNDQTHALFVDSGANTVGVGSSSPTNVLDVAFTASAHTSGISSTNQQSGGFGSVIAFNSNRSDGGGIKTAARIRTEGHENWSSDDTCSSNLIFETRKDNTLAERMRLVTDGKLGVGISTPDCRLHVRDGDAGGVTAATNSVLCLESDGDALLQFLTPNGNSQQIRFGDPQDTGAGFINYNHNTSLLTFGVNGPSRMSINSAGAVAIVGALSKGSGSFKIDHPLPEKTDTHHLVHSFIEGPQADLIYRGSVDLVGGSATVNIDTAAGMTDGTFVLLNTNVQCFTSNESGWTAIKGSVSGNILTITAQDNSCTDTISWMVVGERHDQHMKDTD